MARRTITLRQVIDIAKMIEENKPIKEIAEKVDVSIPFMYNLMNMGNPLYEFVELIIEEIQNGNDDNVIITKYRNVPLSSYKKMRQYLNKLRKAKNQGVKSFELIICDKKVIITGKNVTIKVEDLD